MLNEAGAGGRDEVWPALPLEAWRSTYATLRMWTQVVGKVPMGPCRAGTLNRARTTAA